MMIVADKEEVPTWRYGLPDERYFLGPHRPTGLEADNVEPAGGGCAFAFTPVPGGLV